MKHLIFMLLLLVLFLGCHESNSVEPILDNSAQMNRVNNLDDGTLDVPLKGGNTKEVEFVGNSSFNPDKKCGAVVNGKSLKYTYDSDVKENIVTRWFYDVEVWSPSQMVRKNKTIKTRNVYTINRVEKVTKRGKVISGETWGTFKIFEIGKYSDVLMFQGEFTGEILFKTTTLKLIGKGLIGSYMNRDMIASEKQICSASGGKLHCWTSSMKGSVLERVKIDH